MKLTEVFFYSVIVLCSAAVLLGLIYSLFDYLKHIYNYKKNGKLVEEIRAKTTAQTEHKTDVNDK